jgi:hypothetical protein
MTLLTLHSQSVNFNRKAIKLLQVSGHDRDNE